MKMAQQFVDTVNKHGGNAQLIHLPEIGIRGNTHFMFSDTNNDQVAAEVARWSTLLMLVSAFVGSDNMKSIYDFALNNDFRFLSYGDSSLLHRVNVND